MRKIKGNERGKETELRAIIEDRTDHFVFDSSYRIFFGYHIH